MANRCLFFKRIRPWDIFTVGNGNALRNISESPTLPSEVRYSHMRAALWHEGSEYFQLVWELREPTNPLLFINISCNSADVSITGVWVERSVSKSHDSFLRRSQGGISAFVNFANLWIQSQNGEEVTLTVNDCERMFQVGICLAVLSRFVAWYFPEFPQGGYGRDYLKE